MIDVSVIIVNYNTCVLTNNCINSICEYSGGVSFEIIVVDNNSTDESCNVFNEDKRILFIQNSTNTGFGSANNLGFRHSKGKYLLFLNSDTVLLNNAIKLFYEYAEQHSSDSAYGSVLLNSDFTFGHSFGHFPTIFSELKFFLKLPFKKNNNIDISKICTESFFVDYITGADLFMARTIFEKVGLFDTDFFLYYEETDLQKRMSQLGFKRIIITSPKIIHYHGASSKKKRSQRDNFCGFESSFRYMKKHSNHIDYLMFRLLSFLILFPLIFYWSTKEAKIRFIQTLCCSIK
jgi:GT2 family glycosyltransferase